jgi:hypothetical protein
MLLASLEELRERGRGSGREIFRDGLSEDSEGKVLLANAKPCSREERLRDNDSARGDVERCCARSAIDRRPGDVEKGNGDDDAKLLAELSSPSRTSPWAIELLGGGLD